MGVKEDRIRERERLTGSERERIKIIRNNKTQAMCSLGRRRRVCYYYYVHRRRVPDASRHDDNIIASVTHTFTRKHSTRTHHAAFSRI